MTSTIREPQLKKIAEGREAEIFAYGEGRVLRLFRAGKGGEAMHREVAAMGAVRTVVAIVPEVFGTEQVDGRDGIVMERVDGPDLLSRIASKPWTVWGAGRMLGTVHAQLHAVAAPPGIPTLVARAHRIGEGSPLIPREIAEWGLRRFDAMPAGDRLLHGDFHPANVLLAKSGPAVIDWANVTSGHPDADVARSVLMLRVGAVPDGSPLVVRAGERYARKLLLASYLRAYRRMRPLDVPAVERWVSLRAVDRLAEDIPEERATLLQMVGRAMAVPGPAH